MKVRHYINAGNLQESSRITDNIAWTCQYRDIFIENDLARYKMALLHKIGPPKFHCICVLVVRQWSLNPSTLRMGTPLQYSCLSPRHQPFIGGANNDKKRLGGNDHVCQKGDSPGLFQHFELKSRAKIWPWSSVILHPGFRFDVPLICGSHFWVRVIPPITVAQYEAPRGTWSDFVIHDSRWFPLNRLDGEPLGESIN